MYLIYVSYFEFVFFVYWHSPAFFWLVYNKYCVKRCVRPTQHFVLEVSIPVYSEHSIQFLNIEYIFTI